MIWYQILQTNIIRIIWQTVRRITNEILKIKGLNEQCAHWVHVYEAGLYNWVWGLKYAGCVKERFLIEWHKTKPKVITDQPEDKKVTLQSNWEFIVKLSKLPKVWEKVCSRVLIGFSFAFDWLREWHWCFGPITEWS